MASVAVAARPCLVNSLRISSFAKKPVSGGRLARDRRRSGRSVVRTGFFVPRANNVFIEETVWIVNMVKVE